MPSSISPDFEKIFQCVNSSWHSEQLVCCTNMIALFKRKYPKDEALATLLQGFVIYRTRVLQDQSRCYQPDTKPYMTRIVKQLVRPLNYN